MLGLGKEVKKDHHLVCSAVDRKARYTKSETKEDCLLGQLNMLSY